MRCAQSLWYHLSPYIVSQEANFISLLHAEQSGPTIFWVVFISDYVYYGDIIGVM